MPRAYTNVFICAEDNDRWFSVCVQGLKRKCDPRRTRGLVLCSRKWRGNSSGAQSSRLLIGHVRGGLQRAPLSKQTDAAGGETRAEAQLR